MPLRPAVEHARHIALAILIAFAAMLTSSSMASASTEEESSQIQGTLMVGNGAERRGVPGVKVRVTDAAGAEVGAGVSDEEGAWSVGLPKVGEYTATLDETTLPAGVSLREGREPTATISLRVFGENKSVLFPLTDGSVAAAAPNASFVPFVQLVVDGVKFGLIIAMCAVGLSLIFGTTGLVNFAHGEMVTLGAVLAYLFNNVVKLPLVVSAAIAVVLCAGAGWLFNTAVWKPLRQRGASLIAALVVSIGFSIALRYFYQMQFGAEREYLRDYQNQQKINFFGLFGLVPKELVIMILSTLVLLGVAFGLERTRAGKAMRAVADNRDLAESSGIDVERVVLWVWVGGAALAGLGGVFLGLAEDVNWQMGFRLLLLMFAGVTLGGLGTAYGALFGSLIIGVLIQLSTFSFAGFPGLPSDLKNVGALLLLIVILLVRPQGLFGRAERIG